jgi:hypothetical protein
MLVGNDYFAPSDYESIATTTLGSSASTISLTSIPSTYSHLQLRVMLRTTTVATTASIGIRINGDAPGANNYSQHSMQGNGASILMSASATRDNLVIGTFAAASATSGIFGRAIIDIFDYANTNKKKTIRSLAGTDLNGSGQVGLLSGTYNLTTAISSISFRDNSDATNILAGSTIALYGIK